MVAPYSARALTKDVGTSMLTQASSGARVAVSIAGYDGPLPPVRAYEPPPLADGSGATATRR